VAVAAGGQHRKWGSRKKRAHARQRCPRHPGPHERPCACACACARQARQAEREHRHTRMGSAGGHKQGRRPTARSTRRPCSLRCGTNLPVVVDVTAEDVVEQVVRLVEVKDGRLSRADVHRAQGFVPAAAPAPVDRNQRGHRTAGKPGATATHRRDRGGVQRLPTGPDGP